MLLLCLFAQVSQPRSIVCEERAERAAVTQGNRYADIEVEVLDEHGVSAVIDNALAEAQCGWEDLQEQARAGRFSSETARRAWFVISSFAE